MRPRSLAYCYYCKQLQPLDAYNSDRTDDDVLLQEWIDRHMHGMSLDDHPGGRVFPLGESNVDTSEAPWADLDREVEVVKAKLARQQQEVFALRDELRDDAVVCHRKHHQPELPGKPCRDYHHESKRLGRKDQAPSDLLYLCTYCPYESSVTVAKRALRGDYA